MCIELASFLARGIEIGELVTPMNPVVFGE